MKVARVLDAKGVSSLHQTTTHSVIIPSLCSSQGAHVPRRVRSPVALAVFVRRVDRASSAKDPAGVLGNCRWTGIAGTIANMLNNSSGGASSVVVVQQEQ